jgi:hypothetical protein
MAFFRTLRNKLNPRSSKRRESTHGASSSRPSDAGGDLGQTITQTDASVTGTVASGLSDYGRPGQRTSYLSTPSETLPVTLSPVLPNISPSTHTPSADPSLPSTVRAITADCPQ